MTADVPPPLKRRAPRWMWVVLIASLAVNFLVIGGALGAIWHFRYMRAAGESGAPRHFCAFLAHLPREKRQKIDAILDAQRGEIRQLRSAIRQARRDLVTAFSAPEFDKEKFRALNLKYIEARRTLHEARARTYPDIIAVLDVAERKEFLKWRKWRRKWRHRWRDRDQDDERGGASGEPAKP